MSGYFFNTLKDHLPDDYIVYYEPEIGGRKPDYVVIGPDMGMLVLEIKDYTESTLYELYPNEWRIYNTKGELNTVKNPLHQARDNAFRISDKLKKKIKTCCRQVPIMVISNSALVMGLYLLA